MAVYLLGVFWVFDIFIAWESYDHYPIWLNSIKEIYFDGTGIQDSDTKS